MEFKRFIRIELRGKKDPIYLQQEVWEKILLDPQTIVKYKNHREKAWSGATLNKAEVKWSEYDPKYTIEQHCEDLDYYLNKSTGKWEAIAPGKFNLIDSNQINNYEKLTDIVERNARDSYTRRMLAKYGIRG